MSPEAIRAWIADHKEEFPTNLAELSMYPMPFRRQISLALSPDQHAGLWREHLESFLLSPSELSGPQQAFIREMSDELPDVFARSLEDARARVRELKPRIKELFEPADIVRIFMTLGPPEPEGGLPLPPGALSDFEG